MIHTSTKVQHHLLCHFQITLSFKLQCLALLLPVLIHSMCLKSKSIAWMLNTKKTLDCVLEGETMQFPRTGKSLYLADFQGLWRPEKYLLFSFSFYDSFLWFPSFLLPSFPSFPPSSFCPSVPCKYIQDTQVHVQLYLRSLSSFSTGPFNSQRSALTSNSPPITSSLELLSNKALCPHIPEN